jgi:hypothetical protein
MSKVLGLGTFLGGLGACVGAAASWFALSGDQSLATGEEIVQALHSIEASISQNGVSLNDTSAADIGKALDSFTGALAQSGGSDTSPAPFVARSYSGLAVYKTGDIFDYVAPNGVSSLTMLERTTEDTAVLKFNGSGYGVGLGNHLKLKFGDMMCRFEVIAVEKKTATIRSSCE